MSDRFRVGVTPDFQIQAEGVIEPSMAKILQGIEWSYMRDTGPTAAAEVLDQFDAVIALGTRFPAGSLSGLRRLALIARWGVGYDRIDIAACTRADVMVAITPGAVRRPVAEGIIALVFALAKNLRELDVSCRAGRWRAGISRSMHNVEGKVLGSIGAGNIAGEMFRMARAIGFGRLLAYDPYRKESTDGVELVSLETVLSESDFLAINCPLTEETRGMVGAQELAKMKSSAFLINTARGPLVQQEALVEALRAGRIAGAGLDVFEEEPVPADNPLLQMDNVLVTPHSVAWTREMARDNSDHACRNVLAVVRGIPPEHVVNREVLERPGLQQKLERRRSP